MVKGRAFTLVKKSGYTSEEVFEAKNKIASFLNEVQTLLYDRMSVLTDPELGLFVLVQGFIDNHYVMVDFDELDRRDTKADLERTYGEMIEVLQGSPALGIKPHKLYPQFIAKHYPSQSRVSGIQL